MISDGIENCLQYVENFNPEKSKNPFAYFTQIIYYLFLRRIAKEKKQTHIKNKMIENQSYESWVKMEGDDSSYSVLGFDPMIMLPEDDVYKPKKKVNQKKSGLEKFMEDITGRPLGLVLLLIHISEQEMIIKTSMTISINFMRMFSFLH